MAAVRLLHPFLPLFLFFLLSPLSLSISDSDAMLRLKKSFTNATALDSWTHSSTPCSGENPWVGVVCYRGIITGLRLGQMGLSGKIDIDALKEIPGLRTVSFVDNAFSGPIPEFNQVGALKAIFLSGNQFSGEIPSDYFSKMESLKKVWLSSNNFTGEIPESLGKLPHLIELHLEDNQFSGAIPSIGQPTLTSLNVSNNKLQGEIPSVFSKFNNTSFTGNTGLCGAQLGKDCEAMPVEEPSESQVQSDPGNAALGFGTIAAVILMLVVAAIIVGRRKKGDFDVLGRENPDEGVEVHSSSSGLNWKSVDSSWKARDSSRKGSYSGKQGNGVGDLVVVNGAKGVFGLPDLMKAAAEVLGNGGLGSAYKAVMSSGVAVVVKRMRDMNRVGRDGFDAEIRRLGKLRHPNILTPLAYHFRKEEKLLVYEYIPKGSLLYLLHGDRGPSHAELNWPARLKIVQGIAQGMGYLHSQLASHELPHGNLKSSNVLLSPDYEPLLTDYGFCSVVDPTQASQAMFAYKSPEFVQYRRVSPKCDVYCLGILILEILTGKFPSQYLNNGKGGTDVVQWVLSAISQKRESELFDPEITCSTNSLGEMERLIHIGAACTEQSPEKRLDMKEAIRRIEEIQVEESQDGTSIQITTSLRDGYTDPSLSQSHALNVHEGNGELSTQRTRQESFRDLSGRRNGENFDFSIS